MKCVMSRKLVRNLSAALFIIPLFGVSQGDSAAVRTFNISSGDIEITYVNPEFKVKVNASTQLEVLSNVDESIVITGTVGNTSDHTVTVDTPGVSGAPIANIVLKDVNVDVSTTDNRPAFNIVSDSKVNLTLEGSNSFESGENCAGIQLAANSELTITGDIHSKLAAIGGRNGAGIGGGNSGGDGGTVKISGGSVTATGGIGGDFL